MIVIDFAPGHHGHFLEYVVNNYIFNINAPVENIFQETGAAHNINNCTYYQERKIVSSGHYSSIDNRYKKNLTHIIWVKHDPKLDFVLLTNTYYRCHHLSATGKNISPDTITQMHLHAIDVQSQCLKTLRNNWYTKLQERHFGQAELKIKTDLPTFDFDYASFFSIELFTEELQRLANFLNLTFVYNRSFVDLYQTFIKINQGYNQYVTASDTVNAILNNQPFLIDQNNWQIQSYINHRLSSLFKMFDGELYDSDQYPTNAQDIYKIIIKFVNEYDKKF